jgi:hypothetical protein
MTTELESLAANWRRLAMKELDAAAAHMRGGAEHAEHIGRAQVFAQCGRELARAISSAPTTRIERRPDHG